MFDLKGIKSQRAGSSSLRAADGLKAGLSRPRIQ